MKTKVSVTPVKQSRILWTFLPIQSLCEVDEYYGDSFNTGDIILILNRKIDLDRIQATFFNFTAGTTVVTGSNFYVRPLPPGTKVTVEMVQPGC
jgi:hypothetical protein